MNSCVIFLINIVTFCNGARILAYVPTPSFSHQVVFRPLWRELSLRGHQLTLITTDPINDSSLLNLTEIDLHSSYDIMNKHVMDIITSNHNSFTVLQGFVNIFEDILSNQMEHTSVQKLIHDPNENFDIVLIEQLLAPPVAFAQRFGCPLVGLSSLRTFDALNRLIGTPTHPVVYPDVMLPFEKAETLFERIYSFMFTTFLHIWMFYYEIVKNNQIEQYFGKGFSDVRELSMNVSLVLVNSNPILDQPRPTVPGVIYIGGIHNVAPKPLAPALKHMLDSAKEGFIYFSLGSNVKCKDIPMKTRQILIDTFSELPYKVLWKFELDNLPNKPDNVIISKWFPQTDILKHPNIKLFITQGGLQSMEEAISEGVPMVGIPFFADQPGNVQKMARKGFGLFVDPKVIEKEHFTKTILEVMHNSKYRDKVKEISQLAGDKPIAPLEEAIWWIEYVIRNKGAKHLRSPLISMAWYQYLLLDVLACLILAITLSLYITLVVLRLFIKVVKCLLTMNRKQKSS